MKKGEVQKMESISISKNGATRSVQYLCDSKQCKIKHKTFSAAYKCNAKRKDD